METETNRNKLIAGAAIAALVLGVLGVLASLSGPVQQDMFVASFVLLFGAAGLVAHTAFLADHPFTPASPVGSLLLLAWVGVLVAGGRPSPVRPRTGLAAPTPWPWMLVGGTGQRTQGGRGCRGSVDRVRRFTWNGADRRLDGSTLSAASRRCPTWVSYLSGTGTTTAMLRL